MAANNITPNENSGNSKYNEPEENLFSQVNHAGNFDPLNNEPVKEADRQSTIIGDQTKLNNPIPGAIHKGQTINLDDTNPNQGQPGGSGGPQPGAGPSPQKEEPFNPGFQEMPAEEQNQSAELTAKAMLDGYVNLKKALSKVLGISERKLKQLHEDGEVDMYMNIRYKSGELVSLATVVQRFNEGIKKPFETDQEFIDKALPLLIYILGKKGFALTPEQMLMYLFVMDLLNTGIHIYQCMKDRREMLDNLREATQAMRNNQPAGPVPPDVDPKFTATPPPASPGATQAPPSGQEATVTTATPGNAATPAIKPEILTKGPKLKKDGTPKKRPGPSSKKTD